MAVFVCNAPAVSLKDRCVEACNEEILAGNQSVREQCLRIELIGVMGLIYHNYMRVNNRAHKDARNKTSSQVK